MFPPVKLNCVLRDTEPPIKPITRTNKDGHSNAGVHVLYPAIKHSASHLPKKICSPRSWFQHFWLYLTALSDRWRCLVKCHPGIYAALVHGPSQHFQMLHRMGSTLSAEIAHHLSQTCSPTWICGSHGYCVHLFKIQYSILFIEPFTTSVTLTRSTIDSSLTSSLNL